MAKPSQYNLSELTQQRRKVVASLVSAGKSQADILSELRTQGILNPRTGKAYSRQTIRADMRQASHPLTPLAETIGEWTYVKPQWNARVLINVDTTWRDYIFWDALRRGRAAGYEFSGPAFCLPAAQKIASYVYGKGISAHLIGSGVTEKTRTALHESAIKEANGQPTQSKRNALQGKQSLAVLPKAKVAPNATDNVAWTNAQLNQWLRSIPKFLLNMTVDDYCLGDQYVFVNGDGSLSIASPETVTVEYSASDYRRINRVIVRNKMQNARTEDVYTAEKRVLTVHYYDERGTQVYEYENPIGRIPMVHFANDRSANEIYGRPIYSGGLPIMQAYDGLLDNMRQGVTLLGTPIPMFTGLDNPEATKKDNSTAIVYTDADGNQQTEYKMRIDRQTGLFLGKGSDGKMLATQVGFTKDSLDVLHELKLLWLNETHIPEFMLGGAIASSKASTETQVPPYIMYINFRRLMLEGDGWNPELGIEARGGLLELIYLWLITYKLLNPNIVVGPVQIDWPEIDIFGDQWKYMWGSFLSSTGKITDETVLRMSGYVSDPAGEVMKASGKAARPKSFDDYSEKLRVARLAAAKASLEPPDDIPGQGWYSDYGIPEIDYLFTGDGATASGGVGGVNSVAAHQHFEGEPSIDEWSVNSPLDWIGRFGGHNG